MTPGEAFSPRLERPQEDPSVLGFNDLKGVIQSLEGPLVLGWNDTRGVIQSQDGTTPGVSFRPSMEWPQESHSVLGWNDPREVIQS